jgi:DNA helicase II / ATP-dependent DNA helicase PcrA
VDEAQDTSAEQWSCVKQLATNSQVICLADLDQLIFDHLPGVGAERVDQIRTSLNPLEIDLGSDNNRSPGTEIAVFARDVLHGRVRGAPYNNVSRFRFQANADKRDRAIRQSVGILFRTIRETTGRDAESVGIIVSYGGGVGIISAALRREPEIAHQVLFDEAFVMLACRLGAFLLEPKHPGRRPDEIATALDLLADAFRAKGGKTALKTATQLRLWAHKSRGRKIPSVKLVAALNGLLETISESAHTGDPRKDWSRVKALLRTSDEGNLVTIAGGNRLPHRVQSWSTNCTKSCRAMDEIWRLH